MTGILKRILFSLTLQHLNGIHKYAFIAISLIPLAGIIFLNWSIAEVIVLFFGELFIVAIAKGLIAYYYFYFHNVRFSLNHFAILFGGVLFLAIITVGFWMFCYVTMLFLHGYFVPNGAEPFSVLPFEGFAAIAILHSFFFIAGLKNGSLQKLTHKEFGHLFVGVLLTFPLIVLAFISYFAGLEHKTVSLSLAVLFILLKALLPKIYEKAKKNFRDLIKENEGKVKTFPATYAASPKNNIYLDVPVDPPASAKNGFYFSGKKKRSQ